MAAAAAARTPGLQRVHRLLRPFSSASSTQTTQDIISSLTPVSLPWTPPMWVYDGTLNTAPTGGLQDEGRGEKGFLFSEAREACLSLASRTEARLAPQSQQK